MKISRWDRWRSYLFDVIKETTSSDYNDFLQVAVSRGRYQLCAAHAIYSFDDLYDNYRQAFERIHIREKDIENVLILGLGLGSIPSMLERSFLQKYHYTAVEIDEEVVRLAHEYVLHNLDSPVEVYTVDAAVFMRQNERKFDLICVDVFVDDVIPNKFQQSNFLHQVRSAMSEKGLLLYNRLYRTESDKEQTEHFYHEVFAPVFPRGYYLDLKGNWMLVGQ